MPPTTRILSKRYREHILITIVLLLISLVRTGLSFPPH